MPSLNGSKALKDNSVEQLDPLSDVFSPLQLPCGRSVANRLVKVSLYEHLADFWGGPPNKMHFGLYSHWAHGEWGMIFTGNVQVMSDHLTLGRDVVLPHDLSSSSACQPFAELAKAMHGDTKETGALAIMQLSHGGRQSTLGFGGRWPFVAPMAPSAIPVELTNAGTQTSLSRILSKLLFETPREMSINDINEVVEAFVKGAKLAAKSGFDGVEVHAAHGYLVASFMSPQSNQRTDEYSAYTDPLHFLRRIISAIRAPGVVPVDFVLGIKLNASDYVLGASTPNEERVLGHVQDIASWNMVDFIEVSGGSYESPDFMSETGPKSGSRREALFAQFSQRARASLSSSPEMTSRPLILLTGGLDSPSLMTAALSHGHADLLGVGRLSVELPYLPRALQQSAGKLPPRPPTEHRSQPKVALEQTVRMLWASVPVAFRPQPPPLIGAGMSMAAYQLAMRRLAVLPVGLIPERFPVVPRFSDVAVLWFYRAPGSSAMTFWVVVLLAACVAVMLRFVVL
ncbi:hypothetical protein BC835DRAFT_1262451 [Cytidiella melzeri]|nr:hypothetical protein BC835DRAFT_1262451 [Cytidiella melzeri]